MSEASCDPGEEDPNPPPPPQGQDIEELQQQFEQQQTLISQLKGVLQSNEQQIASKEKEMEEYAAKLSSIKSRTKASKRNVRSGDVKRTSNEGEAKEKKERLDSASKSAASESPMQVETVEVEGEKKEQKKTPKNSEKSRLLRRKLEENRMRFEQRGKELSENKKGIEEMVEHLRMQLEERDHVIQSLQKGLANMPSALAAQDVQSEAEHIYFEGNDQADKREMYAQIVYKDNKIVDLNNRILELELNVLDLQENLKEKDAVIDARTKAITLMSEDMSRKSKTTLDTLDDTREQMRLMQNNFITLETRMRDEQEQLKKHLEEKDRKLKYVEENYKKLESVRFELTTNIAELQEKIVYLQTMNSALHKQVEDTGKEREARGEKQDRVEELLRALDESNKQMLKVKAQHKNKVKSLTKQIESLKKVSESSDEILRLQQRVAELEEDKGNLQLHLVDFDELKATEQSWRNRIQELEEMVKQQNQDLDSHVHALAQLESEKLNLIEDLQDEKKHVAKLEREIKVLNSKVTEIENLKVTSEMKAVELEELVDVLSNEKHDLQQENEKLVEDKSECKQLIDSLQQEKAELLEEITTLQTLLKENNPGDTDSNRSEFQMVSSNNSDEEKWKPTPEETLTEEKHVKDSSNVELYVKLLESELEDARRVISEEKDTIHDLKLKLESKEEEIEMHLEVIAKLEQLGREVSSQEDDSDVNKLSEILKELNEMSGDLEEWKKRCSEVEDRLKCLEDEKVILEGKLEEVTNENSLLNAQLSLQKQVSEELVLKLKESNKIGSDKDEIIKELESKIAEISKEKDASSSSEYDGKTRTYSSDEGRNELFALKEQLEDMKKVCEIHKNEIVTKDAELLRVTTELEDKNVKLEQYIIETEQSAYEQNELKEKETLIEQLRNECRDLRKDLEIVNNNLHESSQIAITMSENSDRIQKLELLLSEKDSVLSEKESELERANQKLQNVTDKIKKLAVNLKAKTVVIQNLEEKEKTYLEDIQEKDEVISKLRQEKENISAEIQSLKVQCEEKDKAIVALSEKVESNIHLQETKFEELVTQNGELVTTNEQLKRDLSMAVEKLAIETRSAEENRLLLAGQISELEEEVNNLKDKLLAKEKEIDFIKEECKKVPTLEAEKTLLEENRLQYEKKTKELIEEIMKKDDELAEISLKLDELSKNIDIKNEHMEINSVKCKELEQIIVTKDMQLTALEDRMSNLQNARSALEAKLQEREAFIESLEQELAKNHSHQQRLEEGLSFIEERRRSIERKFAALGEQLQESDRIKEEAEEHEGELVQRLAALASSEEMLRKRLESLNENNVELSQRISELTLENEDLKKNVVNADSNFKMANKEIERLSMCEGAYNQALETIERLEGDLKKRTAEFERSLREKEQETSQCVENLELDMKNLTKQLEILEVEKRSAMEHCENLNDIKMNLEDVIETLQEKIDSYHAKILELESNNKQRESELNAVIAEKQEAILKLEQKIQNLGESIEDATVSFNNESGDLQMQEILNSNIHLKSEMETITKLLAQKESELQSYQNRLLQLQFGNLGEGSSVSQEDDQSFQRKQLEKSIIEMQEKLALKESQLVELRVLMESANNEMSNMQLQLSQSCKKIEEMSNDMTHLQEIVKYKDIQLQGQMETISQSKNSDKLSQQLESINTDYQTQLSALQKQNSQLHEELVREKAKSVVLDIVSTAQKHVHEHGVEQQTNIPSLRKESRVQFSENVYHIPSQSDVELQEITEELLHKESIPESAVSSEVFTANSSEFSNGTYTKQELVEKLGDLRAELDVVKMERSNALIKVKELELEVNRLLDTVKQLNDVQSRHDVFITSHENASVGDQFRKESSVGSIDEKKEYQVYQNEEEVEHTVMKEVDYERIHSDSHVQHTPVSDQVDLPDPGWPGETAEEEGWGWGAEEARLEEEHMERQKAALSASPAHSELQQQVLELENKIELLEMERNQIAEDLKASQIRSGKMLKKLKDLKLKNESLLRENQELALKKSSEFGSLDLAIEEELKIRIDNLEKELKECKGERDTLNLEKESLQRRIEVLSATNERLTEREQQGIDIDYWQNKNKELNNHIESLQWRIEELMEERDTENLASKSFNLQELQEQITALAADNEQLQNMLEEQRNLRVVAEASLKDLQQYTSLKEANFLQETDMKENYITLKENYDILCKEVETLRSSTEHDSLIAENAVLRENYDVLRRELELLRSNSNSDIIAAEYSSMRNNYEAMYNELEELRSRVDVSNTLQANYESLQMAHDKLINDMNHMQKEYCNMTEKYEIIVQEKSQLKDEYIEKEKTQQQSFEIMIGKLEEEKTELLVKYEKISQELLLMSTEMQHLKDEIEKYKSIIDMMTQEQGKLSELNYTLNEKYTAVTNELQHHIHELEKYKNLISVMTQEQERLNEVIYSLNKKCENLMSCSSVPSKETLVESETNIFSSEKTFPTFQLFSKADKETITDEIKKSPVEIEVQNKGSDDFIAELKMQISKLEEAKQQKIEELDVLRAMFSNEQEEWVKIEENLSKKVEILEGELETIKEAAKRESEIRESLTLKEHELSNIKSQLLDMEEELTKAQYRVEELETQLVQKEEEFQNARQDSENQESLIQQIIASKEQELQKLQETLVLKNQEQEELLLGKMKDIENLKMQIADREMEIENMMSMKDHDLHNLKLQMSVIERKAQVDAEENQKNIQTLEEKLVQSNMEIQNISQALKEKELQVIELQEVLEAREDEIREAVLQIRDRNVEIQQLKQSSGGVIESTSSMRIPKDTERPSESQPESNNENELDVALYMLHQRDVRCEELTLELMQLLEERDTLQLRLSTALRINEELRKKICKTSTPSSPLRESTTHLMPSTSSTSLDDQENMEQVISSVDPEPATGAPAEESGEDLRVLADKLSQLHSVDYRRDVTLQEEREQRHSEQVRLLQPRGGSGVLVESNYTLSRDVQSPSTVLLNWIWGRSTPKVLHI